MPDIFYRGPEHAPFLWQGGEKAALLVHGFFGTPYELRHVGNSLHEAGWTVQGLLLPGFGADYSHMSTVLCDEWLASVVDSLHSLQRDYAQIMLVGNSMGSALALQAAAQADRPVAGLIFFAPFLFIRFHWLDWTFTRLASHLPAFRPYAHADFSDPATRERLREIVGDADLTNANVQQQIRQFSLPMHAFTEVQTTGRRGWAAAPAVRAPVLICQGTHDSLAHPTVSRALAHRLPGPVGYVQVESDHELAHMSRESERHLLPLVTRFAARTTGSLNRQNPAEDTSAGRGSR